MATLAELQDALINADRAGDAEAARRLADAIVAVRQSPKAQSIDPTEGNSFGRNALIATGKGMTSVMRAVGVPADTLRGWGLPGTKEEADVQDAPLMRTAGGKVGNVIGTAAPAAVGMLVPGANTYLGASLVGGATGAAFTEGDAGERAKAALFGAGGGALGKGIGDALSFGVPKAVSWLADKRNAAQLSNAPRDAAAVMARDAGYVLPPADVNPSGINEALNGLAGKIKTAQFASQRNQGTTNTLVKRELGIPADQPLTVDALRAIRAREGQAYEAVSNTGVIQPGPTYDAALDKIVAPYVKAAQGFPNAKTSPIVAEIEALRSPQFDAASAVSMIKKLRGDADAAYASGNKDLGKALKDGAAAVENAIDEHLTSIGAPKELLQNFRDARQTIAKTYTVERALNNETGDVSAQVLAKALQKGKPLSGDLETVAKVGSAFPRATQSLKEAPKSLSPLDYMAALMSSGTTGPLGAAAVMARPGVRSMLLSGPYQRTLGSPQSYAPGLLEQTLPALENEYLRRAMPLGTGLLSANLGQ